MKKKIALYTSIILITDQIIKYFVSNYLENIVVIKNVLSFTLVKNNGVAFSALSGNRIFIVILSIILIGFIFYFLQKDYINKGKHNNLVIISFSLLLGGTFGNLIDRVFRGYVIDYINISFFSIFNLADICITLGVILLTIDTLFENKKIRELK